MKRLCQILKREISLLRLNSSQIRNMYWDKKMTIRQMNVKLHFGTKELGLYMKEQGIPLRTSSESRVLRHPCRYDVYEITQLYCEKKWSLMRIANKFDVSAELIRLFMKENNISRRPMRDAVMLNKDVYNLNFSGNESEIGYILGVMDGDGFYESRGLSLQVKDKIFAERFVNSLRNLGFDRKMPITRNSRGMWVVKVYSVNIKEFFASISFEQLSDVQKIFFINGFFDAEGSIVAGRRSNGNMRREILCYNTNKYLIDEISNFLNLLDIKNSVRISYKKGYTSYHKDFCSIANHDCYVISVCEAKSQKLFCKYFTLFGRKQKKLNMIRRCIG